MMTNKLWANALLIHAVQMGTQIGPILSNNVRDRKEDPRKACVPSKKKRAALRAARKSKANK